MNTSSQWLGLSLVVCSAACGSSFQANDSAATGGSPSGGNASGGNASGGDASGGDASGGSGNAAGSFNGGRGGKGGKGGSGGSVSTGGNLGIAGDVSVVGGGMGVSGGSGAGGVAGTAGSMSGGGPSGGGPSGGSSSGGATAGTGGGSGASCTELWSSYQAFVAKTAVCDAGSTVECVANNTIVDQCNCAVPFNHNSASLSGAKKALQDWKDAGCVFKPCACLTQGTPACLMTSGTTAYTCQFGPAIIQM